MYRSILLSQLSASWLFLHWFLALFFCTGLWRFQVRFASIAKCRSLRIILFQVCNKYVSYCFSFSFLSSPLHSTLISFLFLWREMHHGLLSTEGKRGWNWWKTQATLSEALSGRLIFTGNSQMMWKRMCMFNQHANTVFVACGLCVLLCWELWCPSGETSESPALLGIQSLGWISQGTVEHTCACIWIWEEWRLISDGLPELEGL